MDQNITIPGFYDISNEDLQVDIAMVRESLIVLKLKGFIDTYNTPFLSKKVNIVITHGFSRFIFDMREINYMSSTAIGIFTSFLKILKPINGDIVFIGVNPKVYEVFELIGFSKFFKFSDDITSALQVIKPSAKRTISKASVFFPKTFRCSCRKVLKVSRSGKYRCPQCRTTIAVSPEGALKKIL